jgi:hypothetical protein
VGVGVGDVDRENHGVHSRSLVAHRPVWSASRCTAVEVLTSQRIGWWHSRVNCARIPWCRPKRRLPGDRSDRANKSHHRDRRAPPRKPLKWRRLGVRGERGSVCRLELILCVDRGFHSSSSDRPLTASIGWAGPRAHSQRAFSVSPRTVRRRTPGAFSGRRAPRRRARRGKRLLSLTGGGSSSPGAVSDGRSWFPAARGGRQSEGGGV